MKIDRRSFIAASSSALVLARSSLGTGGSAQKTESRPMGVYTTADKTDYRLSHTGPLAFKPIGQPLETQICVFVDPSKTFQTFLGIGGALTDASAETFAKLPKPKQQELLSSYFDRENGIGYT